MKTYTALITTKVICRATDCIYNERQICVSEEIIYDPQEGASQILGIWDRPPQEGCLTYEVLEDVMDFIEDEILADEKLLDDNDDIDLD